LSLKENDSLFEFATFMLFHIKKLKILSLLIYFKQTIPVKQLLFDFASRYQKKKKKLEEKSQYV
jgi:hypothetical protein